jgi:uncharacterized RDD family membrane protein YckC
MAKKLEQYQTSEKVKVNFEIAGISYRIVSFILDALIQGAIFFIFYIIIFVLILGGIAVNEIVQFQTDSYAAVVLVLLMLGGIAITAYRMIFELVWKGQTPGKRILNIRVVRDDGSYVNAFAVILRNIFRIIDMLPISHLVGVITMIISKKNKRIGDIVAGTIVIAEKKVFLPKPVPEINLDCFDGIDNIVEKFTSKDREIIKTFCDSAGSVQKDARIKIEDKLVELIEKRIGVQCPDNVDKTTFIRALYSVLHNS